MAYQWCVRLVSCYRAVASLCPKDRGCVIYKHVLALV